MGHGVGMNVGWFGPAERGIVRWAGGKNCGDRQGIFCGRVQAAC